MPGHRGFVGTVSGKVQWPCPVCCTYAWGPVCKAGLEQEQAWGGAGGAGRAEGPGEAMWSRSLWAGSQADDLKRGPGGRSAAQRWTRG